uniref:Rap-GAP domain-containing protein n=4 Tax=Wuchereria bancrofti TaxID=6293 RepID=A0AAF5Q077_WUCBA
MFARKVKSADFTASLQRFADLHRDCASRAKHLKLALDALCIKDKRQFMEDYSFETFHLVDELLLQADLTQTAQSVLEVESALWTLEQLLCLAPGLVGNGWQKHAIEYVLKKALFPHNLLAVRKIALRLFIIWYQSLAIYSNSNSQLDTVFQCLLPHFPLRNNLPTESILHTYCQSTASIVGPGPIRHSPLVSNPNSTAPSAKERAQLLQVYLDKFLEYCTRETVRIEWSDENIRLECAKFILDRVIVLYIYEIFPDIETNGVDIYGGWEGGEGQMDIRDTADPVVIARYWLIRWMATVALTTNNDLAVTGQLLYRKALFSSRKATNTLLTLLKEAVMLPLPCSNVIHKVFSLINTWLLQRNLPPFIGQEEIAIESLSLLLIHFLTSFFHSPYLPAAGERLSSAISLTQSLLQTTRDLSNPSTYLQNSLSTRVWCELIRSLAAGVRNVTSRSDAYGRATSGALAQNLLGVIVFVRAISGIEIEERVWDDVLAVFQSGCWMQMIEQWSRVVGSVTRALILNLFEIDVAPPTQSTSHQIVKRVKSNETTSTQEDGNAEFSEETRSENDNSVEDENAQFTSVVQSTGDAVVWLRVWMRIVNLVSPLHAAHSYLAVQTISKTINTLLRLSGTDALIHWICTRLLLLPPSGQAHCLPAYCAVLSTVNPPPLIEAHILLALGRAIVSERFTVVLEYMPFMSKDYLTALARPALNSLAQLIKQSNFSPRSVQVAALLSPDHAVGETLLLNLLAMNSSEVPLQSYSLALHALALLIIERADTKLMTQVMNRVCMLKTSSLLHMFCADLNQLKQLGLRDKLAAVLQQALDFMKDDCLAGELLWQSVSTSLMDCQLRRSLLERVVNGRRLCLEGFLLTYYRQFPLPSFTLAHCNSLENTTGNSHYDALTVGRVFFDQGRAILSVDMDNGVRVTSRTPVGKHCWCFTREHTIRRQMNCVNNWLRKLALRPKKILLEMTSIKGVVEDPFEKLPQLPRTLQADPIECNEMYFFIQQNRRLTTSISASRHSKTQCLPRTLTEEKFVLWRTLAADLRLFSGTRQISPSFNRDIRHLDHTYSREVHKVAVIYVAKGQEDKVSVLSNSCGSVAFNEFILRLGWQVQIGHQHYGYSGGLPSGVSAPYYASADTEIIFHVSTMLDGDITQKLKHLGNDEVHVVWSENDRPYRRDTIATRFCDVLIILYRMSHYLFRVRIETQRPLEFGPLFDGAHIHICMLPHLVRDTVVNASRAYRLSQQDCARPLEHREKVFEETRRHLHVPSPSFSISQTFALSLNSYSF